MCCFYIQGLSIAHTMSSHLLNTSLLLAWGSEVWSAVSVMTIEALSTYQGIPDGRKMVNGSNCVLCDVAHRVHAIIQERERERECLPTKCICHLTIQYFSFDNCLQVDLAVCSVASDSPILSNCGEVASCFAKAGGDKLCKQYADIGGMAEGQIACQPACGKLKCRRVVFVGIRQWTPHSEQVKIQYVNTLCTFQRNKSSSQSSGNCLLFCTR